MTNRLEIVEHELCYEGFFRLERFRLRHSLFAGGLSPVLTRELLERGRAAAMLPYDPDRDQVVLIEQFRIGALEAPEGPWLMEIVAGMIEEGEAAADVVRREAMEEAGCVVEALEPICDFFVSPGGTSERIALFCGKVDASTADGIHGIAEEGEDIKVHVMSFEAAWQLLKDGAIDSATPIIALQWLMLNRETLRARWAGPT